MLQISLYVNGRVVSEINEVGDREISIGRSPGCVVRIPDPTVSRLHAVILKTDQGFVLEKRTSVGSLMLNGQEVENAVLQGGEELELANVILRINFADEPEVDAEKQTGSIPMDLGAMGGMSAAPVPASHADDMMDDDGATKIIGANQAIGMLRFEPGAANHTEFAIKKDLVLVGRASNCDVVIFEKRASRKHFEIRREGLSFYFRDLESANGSKVNEKDLRQAELVPGDIIRVGETQIEFTIENKEFFKNREQFMPVPQEALPAGGLAQVGSENTQVGMSVPQEDLADGSKPTDDDIENEPSLIKKRWKQFQRLPRVQRLGVIAIFAFIAIFVLEEPPPEKPKKPPIRRDAQGNPIITIDRLPPAEQKMVQESYKKALLSRESQDFETMLRELKVVLSKVTEYRDAKLYLKEAVKGIEEKERLEREAKKREYEQKLAQEVAALVVKGQRIFNEALKDEDKRPLLDDMIQEIFSKDPNNNQAQIWQNRIKQRIAQEREEEIERQKQEALKKAAEGEFAKLEQMVFEQKYIEAMKYADALIKKGYREDNYQERVREKKQEAKAKVESIINPLLERAKREREPGGDLVKSKDLYREVLQTDPANREANEGLLAIRSVLHLRAKRLYAQAILAESISALDEAKQKLELCVRVAPERDPYQRRCRSKLRKYEAFSKEGP